MKKTRDDLVSQSYDMNSLMTVCLAALRELQETDLSPDGQCEVGAIYGALFLAKSKWDECHDALEVGLPEEVELQSP